MRKMTLLLAVTMIMTACLKLNNPLAPDDASAGTVASSVSSLHLINGGLTASAQDVHVTGDYAYVACGASGLQILDVRVPNRATLVTTVTNDLNNAFSVYVDGNYAYVADRDTGVRIVDVTAPASAAVINTLWLGACREVTASDGLAYVSLYTNGLQVYDVNDPLNPTQIFSGSANQAVESTLRIGDMLYSADNGLMIYAVSSNTVTFEDRLLFGNRPQALAYKDHYLIVGGSNAVTVTDLDSPRGVRLRWSAVSNCNDFYLDGDHLHIADGERGLVIVDLSDPLDPFVARTISTGGSVAGVYGYDIYIFVADEKEGLLIYSR